jgi:hypothetical protein
MTDNSRHLCVTGIFNSHFSLIKCKLCQRNDNFYINFVNVMTIFTLILSIY